MLPLGCRSRSEVGWPPSPARPVEFDHAGRLLRLQMSRVSKLSRVSIMQPLVGRYRESEGINYSTRRRLVIAFGDWVQQRIIDGDLPFLLTFLFRPLPGSQSALLVQMWNEISRCYATFLRQAFIIRAG
jgi:hypothetical protein